MGKGVGGCGRSASPRGTGAAVLTPAQEYEATLSRTLRRRDGHPFERLYHVADSFDAERIVADGLTAGYARRGPDGDGSDFSSGHLHHVYLWPTIEQARRYAMWVYGWGGEMQIVEVDAAALPLEEDPYFVDDAESAERWRAPADYDGEVLAWRTAVVEPDRLLGVVDVIDSDDESAYEIEELYGSDPSGWPPEEQAA